ncbi:nitroreductase [Pseudoxanthomonas sp. SORGH_AS 997]|uniref:Putative NAD(P)H nitroreductase n=2 Tax=Lysobacteraceae TaxID=32033 RepID=A0AAW8GDP1_9GAMM|nr:nitroreductase [Pseudoxanthomonas winnipegensis]MDQ1133170.1 nitroreductase [Pseudoxanthomonas winnipegensis]MDR6136829.1 nitroreductase [Pseudoxanthomonas sp. SORGH_AS_0997]
MRPAPHAPVDLSNTQKPCQAAKLQRMPTPELLQALDQRRSVPSKQLHAPGPDTPTLLRMLESASRVPDHGKLVPWRFIRIEGQARAAMSRLLEARTRQKDPQASEAALEKERGRFSYAPVIITVVARLQPGHKVPLEEQWLTAGSVCFALLQAAQALGFGAQWLTGWAASDPVVCTELGLGPDERIAGFIHIGTATIEVPERERPDAAALLTDWTGERA